MNHAPPQTRQVRERDQAGNRPQLRLIRVPEQSVFANSPRQQARQQSVRILDQATILTRWDKAQAAAAKSPQENQSFALSMSKLSTQIGNGFELELAGNRPRIRSAVIGGPDTSSLVHIRSISHNGLV
jgi:hypothetical protein